MGDWNAILDPEIDSGTSRGVDGGGTNEIEGRKGDRNFSRLIEDYGLIDTITRKRKRGRGLATGLFLLRLAT